MANYNDILEISKQGVVDFKQNPTVRGIPISGGGGEGSSDNPDLRTIIDWNLIDPKEVVSGKDFNMGAMKIEPWTIFSGNQYELLDKQVKGTIPSNVWFEVKSSLMHMEHVTSGGANILVPLGLFKGCNYGCRPNEQRLFSAEDSFVFHIARSHKLESDEQIVISLIGLNSTRTKAIPLQMVIVDAALATDHFTPDDMPEGSFTKGGGFSGWFKAGYNDLNLWNIPSFPAELIDTKGNFNLSNILYFNISGNTHDRTSVVPGTYEKLDVPVEFSIGNILLQKGDQHTKWPYIPPYIFDSTAKGNTTQDPRILANNAHAYAVFPFQYTSLSPEYRIFGNKTINFHKNKTYLFIINYSLQGPPNNSLIMNLETPADNWTIPPTQTVYQPTSNNGQVQGSFVAWGQCGTSGFTADLGFKAKVATAGGNLGTSMVVIEMN